MRNDGSRPTERRVRRSSQVLTTVLIVAGVSCRDVTQPTRASPTNGTASHALERVQPAVSHIAFDMSVIRGTTKGLNHQTASLFHVERTRSSDTTWKTSIQILDATPQAAALNATWRPRRVEIGDDGTMTMWRGDGTSIGIPRVGELPGGAVSLERVTPGAC